MATTELVCWKCAEPLGDVLMPFPRLAKCKACKADLHVCRMCEFFDTTVSNSCREPIADMVNDKNRSNFCGYFQVADNTNTDHSAVIDSNKESLESLFGLAQGTSKLSTSDAAQSKHELDALFGLDDNKKD